MEQFIRWLNRKNEKNKPIIADADRILPLISAAGEVGVLLSDLRGSMNRLEPKEFDNLVQTLLSAGMVTAAERGGEVVLRVKSF